MATGWRWFWGVVIGASLAALALWGLASNAKLFVTTALNGLTLGALYFLVASGFTLVFGLMRNVNLAHGSLYPARRLPRLRGRRQHRLVAPRRRRGIPLRGDSSAWFSRSAVFRFMQGEDLRQTLVTIALSIMLADIMLWIFGGQIYQFDPPRIIFGANSPAHRRSLPDVPARPARDIHRDRRRCCGSS